MEYQCIVESVCKQWRLVLRKYFTNIHLKGDIMDQHLYVLAKRIPDVKHIRITYPNFMYSRRISHKGLQYLQKECTSIESIVFEKTHLTSDMTAIVFQMKKLKDLQMIRCKVEINPKLKIAPNLIENLTKLICTSEKAPLAKVVNKFKNLNYLDTSAFYHDIIDLPKLQHLILRVDDHFNVKLLSMCKSLTHVKLNSSTLQSSSLNHLINSVPKLEHLELAHSVMLEFDKQLFADLKQNSTLKSLKLKCPDLMELSDIQLTRLSTLKDLEELDLFNAKKLTDYGVINLLKSCPKLVKLRLPYCEKISDELLYFIAENRIKMKYLCVSGKDITISGVNKVLKGCPNLETIHLIACPNITALGIEKFNQEVGGYRKKVKISSSYMAHKNQRKLSSPIIKNDKCLGFKGCECSTVSCKCGKQIAKCKIAVRELI